MWQLLRLALQKQYRKMSQKKLGKSEKPAQRRIGKFRTLDLCKQRSRSILTLFGNHWHGSAIPGGRYFLGLLDKTKGNSSSWKDMRQAYVRAHGIFSLKGIIHEKVLLRSGWLSHHLRHSDQEDQEDQSCPVWGWACVYWRLTAGFCGYTSRSWMSPLACQSHLLTSVAGSFTPWAAVGPFQCGWCLPLPSRPSWSSFLSSWRHRSPREYLPTSANHH